MKRNVLVATACILSTLVLAISALAADVTMADFYNGNLIKNPDINLGNKTMPFNYSQGQHYWKGNGTNFTYAWDKNESSLYVVENKYDFTNHTGDGKWVPDWVAVKPGNYLAGMYYRSGAPARLIYSLSQSWYLLDHPQYASSQIFPATYIPDPIKAPSPDYKLAWFRVTIPPGYDRATVYMSLPGDTEAPYPHYWGELWTKKYFFTPLNDNSDYYADYRSPSNPPVIILNDEVQDITL